MGTEDRSRANQGGEGGGARQALEARHAVSQGHDPVLRSRHARYARAGHARGQRGACADQDRARPHRAEEVGQVLVQAAPPAHQDHQQVRPRESRHNLQSLRARLRQAPRGRRVRRGHRHPREVQVAAEGGRAVAPAREEILRPHDVLQERQGGVPPRRSHGRDRPLELPFPQRLQPAARERLRG